uniref:Uncharacterized protein n=1 Tax=Tanacetum cinerariifolium TaxID=118510 RepID=A0A6L2M8J0_TANCI|nr:hypothetical protein [Tanacetum cinerariifolium]
MAPRGCSNTSAQVKVCAFDNRGVGRSYIPAKTSKYIALYLAETSAHDWNLFSYHLLALHSHTKPMRMSFVIEIGNENENWNGKQEGVSKHKVLQGYALARILESFKEYLRSLATTHMIIPQIKILPTINMMTEVEYTRGETRIQVANSTGYAGLGTGQNHQLRPSNEGNANGLSPWQSKSIPCGIGEQGHMGGVSKVRECLCTAQVQGNSWDDEGIVFVVLAGDSVETDSIVGKTGPEFIPQL